MSKSKNLSKRTIRKPAIATLSDRPARQLVH